MKVAIYNDCHLRGRPHFGTELVMEAFSEQLRRVDIELLGTVKVNALHDRRILDRADLVLVNGEGSYHHGARPDLVRLGEEYPSILINSVYEDTNPPRGYKYVAVRESMSQDALAKQGVMADLVPDVIFASRRLQALRPMRGRGVGHIRHYGHRVISTLQNAHFFLEEMSRYRAFTSESFHAVAVCAIVGAPVSAIGGNTHKLKGLCRDLDVPDLYDHDFPPRPRVIDAEEYIFVARMRINKMFEKLHLIMRNL